MHATCLIRHQPDYRREAFVAGLQAVGYMVSERAPREIRRDDLLVIWNRYGQSHDLACRYETAGARVIVVENGYLGREWKGEHWYALSLSHHNGGGQWPHLSERWDTHGIPLLDWRAQGDHILVLAQRGIGPSGIAEPHGWPHRTADALKRRTRRKIVLREHPGEKGRAEPLDQALRNVWACVTWASGAGLKAITLGVPVFHGLNCWIGAAAARPWTHDLEDPYLGDRAPMLRNVASAMWRLDEIKSGACFRALLS